MQRQSRSVIVGIVLSLAALASACGKKAGPVEVVIALREPRAAIASATVLVDYSQSAAKPLRSRDSLSCGAIVPNMTADFSDDEQGHLTIRVRAPQGVSTPVDIAVCRMVPDSPDTSAQAIASRLNVAVIEGTDMAGAPLGAQKLAQARAERDRGADHEAGQAKGKGEPAAETEPQAAPQAGAPPRAAAQAPPSGQAAPPSGAPAHKPGAIPPGADSGSAARPAEQAGQGTEAADRGRTAEASVHEEANDDSDTDRAARSYEITFGVAASVGPLGALQFDITHRGSGGFAGAGAHAKCRNLVPGALASFNDMSGGTVKGAMASLEPGITTPGVVTSCVFKSREVVNTGDFSIRVVDAATPEGEAVANVRMAVVSISPMD